jgi:DNA-binding FadR family transcriptional regulator
MTATVGTSVVRVPKAGELVADQLRRQIITGELESGDPLPSETVLMARYGVSRPTLREAFRILESEAAITVLRGAHGGARVLTPDDSIAARHLGLLLQYKGVPLVDVYRARDELEVMAVGIVGAGDPQRLTEIETLVKEAGTLLENAVEFARVDTRIHQAIADATGIETLSVLMSMILRIMDAHNSLFLAVHGEEHERQADQMAYRAYTRLLKLLRSNDADGAVKLWKRHLSKVKTYMTDDSDTTLVEILS